MRNTHTVLCKFFVSAPAQKNIIFGKKDIPREQKQIMFSGGPKTNVWRWETSNSQGVTSPAQLQKLLISWSRRGLVQKSFEITQSQANTLRLYLQCWLQRPIHIYIQSRRAALSIWLARSSLLTETEKLFITVSRSLLLNWSEHLKSNIKCTY